MKRPRERLANSYCGIKYTLHTGLSSLQDAPKLVVVITFYDPMVLFVVGSIKPRKPYDHSWIASDSVPSGERLARSAIAKVFVVLSKE